MLACRDGHTAVVKMLIDGGVDLNLQNQVSSTVRYYLSTELLECGCTFLLLGIA
jgi:hypothetical protein